MKKISILIVSLFVFILTIQAQSQIETKRYLGLKAGLVFSTVDFLPSIEQDVLLEKNFGVQFKYLSEKHLGVQLELNNLRKGWKTSTDSEIYSIDYLELPLLTHIYVGNKRRMFINLGPSISYAYQTSASFDKETTEFYLIENKFDYGLCGGVGLEYLIAKMSFSLESRYMFSLGDVYSNRKEDMFARSSHRNILVNINCMYQF